MRLTKRSPFGLILPEHQSCAAPQLAGLFEIEEVSEWARHVIPPYNQGSLGSCVGHATANYIEALLRKVHGRGVLSGRQQLNSEAIYHKGREMYWSGKGGEGLYLHQGFAAAMALGIIPKCGVRNVDLDLRSISKQLRRTPLIMGQMIHRGWSAPAANGFIKWSSAGLGGHAILMTGVLKQKDQFYVHFLNSWGRGWGYGGTGILNEHDYLKGQYTRCLYVDLDESDLRKHDGWRRWVINKA